MINKNIELQIKELKGEYKELTYRKAENNFFVEGFLTFSRSYNGISIKDSYFIQIEIPGNYPKKLPTTKEIGGRLHREPDNHVNCDGTLCLAAPLEEKMIFSKQKSLLGYVNELVIPFLYSASYKEKYGKMPFGERPHGDKGVLDFYKDFFKTDNYKKAFKLLLTLASNNYKGFHKCPCGSNKLLKNCHGKYFNQLKSYKKKHDFKKDCINCYEILPECLIDS